MSDAAIVFAVLGVLVVVFVGNWLPVELVAIGGSLTLAATGVLTVEQSLAGFGDTTIIFIAALFVVSEGIDASGVTTWAGQELIARAGASRTRLVTLTMLLVALLTAVISVNGAVAALLPMVVVVALRVGEYQSQLLMPLAFGAHAGALLTLTGTPVHILVSDAAVDAGAGSFSYFEFALAGIPAVAGAIAIVVVFGPRLLPRRNPATMPPDLSDHARTLIDQYALGQWVARLHVNAGSSLVGTRVSDLGDAAHPELTVFAIDERDRLRPGDATIRAGDALVARGEAEAIHEFATRYELIRAEGDPRDRDTLINPRVGVAEVVVPPRSEIVGTTMYPGMVTASGDYVVLAIQRNGENLDSRPTRLAAGDTLLLQGAWAALDDRIERDRDVRVVDAPAAVRRQALPMGPGARPALLILTAMVVLLATGAVPPAVAALLAAGVMILTRVVSVQQAYRSISWTTVVLVGAMIPLSEAFQRSGAADRISDTLIAVVGDAGPHALLVAVFVLTAVLGQLISNTATALIVIPIAVTAAADLGVSVRPVLMCVTVAAAAAFLTPVATAANLVVMEPGDYEFSDYWKLGLPMLLLFMLVATVLVPVVWAF
jgi:di/tricarboxylate transporter